MGKENYRNPLCSHFQFLKSTNVSVNGLSGEMKINWYLFLEEKIFNRNLVNSTNTNKTFYVILGISKYIHKTNYKNKTKLIIIITLIMLC